MSANARISPTQVEAMRGCFVRGAAPKIAAGLAGCSLNTVYEWYDRFRSDVKTTRRDSFHYLPDREPVFVNGPNVSHSASHKLRAGRA